MKNLIKIKNLSRDNNLIELIYQFQYNNLEYKVRKIYADDRLAMLDYKYLDTKNNIWRQEIDEDIQKILLNSCKDY